MEGALRQTVSDLIQSIEEALFVFEEQSRHAEAARPKAEATQERFMQFLEARRTSAETPDIEERRQRVFDTLGGSQTLDDARTLSRLGVRWEEGFCNISDAFMGGMNEYTDKVQRT